MRRDTGFVLLNALIVVIIIASISTAVLTLTARGRERLSDTQADAQMSLYLDAAEALIPQILERAWDEDGPDHLDQFWAGDDLTVPIDRGVVSVKITDLQGRLNLNLLNIEEDRAEAETRRLFDELDLPRALLGAVSDWLAEGGPPNVSSYLTREVAILPRGGTTRLLDELRQVEGMTPEYYEELSQYVSVLPLEVSLNVNTAPSEVLAAVLPEFNTAQIADILRERGDEPFDSEVDFRTRLSGLYGQSTLENVPLGRLTTRTAWFEARVSAEIEGRRLSRRLILRRSDEQEGATRRILSLLETPSPPTRPEAGQ